MRALRCAGAGALAIVALVALVGRGAAAPAADDGKPERPNVVVLMADDQTAASQPVMGRTNELIGAKGASFTNNFANWPLCCPSRATFFTGQYAHNHQVLGNTPPLGGFDRLDTTETLPVWLQRAGYYTAHVGKFLNGYETGPGGAPAAPAGWSEWQGTMRTYTYYGMRFLEGGQPVTYGSIDENPDDPAHPETYATDVTTDKAVQLIGQRAPLDQPFFLSVAYLAPHSGFPDIPDGQPQSRCEDTAKPAVRHQGAFGSEPLPSPPNLNEADVSDKPAGIASRRPLTDEQLSTATRFYRCRLESLLAVDEGVERVVEALRAQGELDDTLLIYTSDNGFFHGEHRILTNKNRVYEEAIRIPLQIRGPGMPKGVTVDDLAINADLAPTILDAARAKPGRIQDGRSLLPFAEHPERRRGRELLIEQHANAPDEEGDPGVSYSAVRTARFKYVENATGEVELYDLEADPYELTNLHGAPAYAKAEAALASRLASLRTCAGRACRTKPALKLKLPRSVREHGRSCRRPRDFVARVRGADAKSVSAVTFRVRSKRAGRDRRKPLKETIESRLLRAKRRPEIRAIAELVDGRKLSLQKRIRICRG